MVQMVYSLTATSHVGVDSLAYAISNTTAEATRLTGTIERAQA